MDKWVYTVTDASGSGNDSVPLLFVPPEAVARHWLERQQVLGCSTWGEVRALGREIYEEVLGLAGYGSFHEYIGHFRIEGAAPGLSPSVVDEAEQALLRAAGPPGDDVSFEAYNDLGACADGDWPPSIYYLLAKHVPEELLARYGQRWVTVINGIYASIGAEHSDAVLGALRARGDVIVRGDWVRALLDDEAT